MPFTLSHPVAVLPLRRSWFGRRGGFAALVIGCMTPDLSYYIPFLDVGGLAHTLPGSLIVCLPSGLFLLSLFYLLRKQVCFLLPQPHRGILMPLCTASPKIDWGTLVATVICLIVGAWTHIFWDSFTHRSGWFVRRIGWLNVPVFSAGSTIFPAYYLLQQLSTAAGAAILLICYLRWLGRNQKTHPINSRLERWRHLFWIGVALISSLVSLPLAVRAASPSQCYPAYRVFMFQFGVGAVATAFCLVVVSSILVSRRITDLRR
jgi:hypothetical protein